MNEPQNSFELDGTRPIENTDLEIVDSFEEDGKRPVAESPSFMTQNQKDRDLAEDKKSSDRTSSSIEDSKSDTEETETLDVDGKRPIENSDSKVVGTFEDDGKRPIMANEYEVVDTLDIDGKRPITSESNIGKQ